jgi:hypothetical protein
MRSSPTRPRSGWTRSSALTSSGCSTSTRTCSTSLSASTLSDYRNVARCYLLPGFGAETPLEKITTGRIDAYRERLLGEGRLSRRSVQKVMVLLHGVLKRAKRRKWVTTNPAEGVERVRVRRSGDFNVLTPIEVEAVARAAGPLRDRFYAALQRAGLGHLREKTDPIVFHDLRHTFGTPGRPGLAASRCAGLHGARGHPDDHALCPPRAEGHRGGRAHSSRLRGNRRIRRGAGGSIPTSARAASLNPATARSKPR